ncbi:MAG: YwaF family protein [Clostridia bacterium]|nr:YwaF family protein [Clostridia bacterium]
MKNIILFLQTKMEKPIAFGWFHILCLSLMAVLIFILHKKKRYNEKQLKIILAVYGIVALILEILKQLIWTYNYDFETTKVTWDYNWYAFPFQLCTTPIFVCIICLFLKKCKIRNYLLSYISYITIIGSITTMILPDSCFTNDILVNIHTMWLHLGSFVVSVYLLMSGEVELKIKSLIRGFCIFLIFVVIALSLNVSVYNSGILNGETFNMFYISPYFTTELPVFNVVQENVCYILYLIIYILALLLGGIIVLSVAYLIKLILKKVKLDGGK